MLVSQGIWSSNSLYSLKVAPLNFMVLTPIFARPIFLKNANLTRVLQPRLPLILMSSMISALVSTRTSSASPLVGLSSTWTRKLLLMDSRSLLDHYSISCCIPSSTHTAALGQNPQWQQRKKCHPLELPTHLSAPSLHLPAWAVQAVQDKCSQSQACIPQ